MKKLGILCFNVASIAKLMKGSGLIVIAGPTCSGKSTAANLIRQAFVGSSKRINVFDLDHYFRDYNDQSVPHDQQGRIIFDSPKAYHASQAVNDVKSLLSNKAIFMPMYDKSTNMRVKFSQKVEPSDCLIVEGLFAIDFLKEVNCANKIQIYLEVDEKICLQRRLARDVPQYKIKAAVVEKAFHERIWPNYSKDGFSQRLLANIIFDSGY